MDRLRLVPSRIAAGFTAPFRALAFSWRHLKRLGVWLILPIVLNVAAIAFAAFFAFGVVPGFVATVWPMPTGWLFGLWVGLMVTLALTVFVVAVVAVYLLSGILASPFYDRLSAEVEMIELGDLPEGGPWTDIGWSIAHSALGAVCWLTLLVCGFLLNFIPGIGTVIEFIVTWLGTAFLLAREMLDGPMTRRRKGFLNKLGFVAKHFDALGTFGLAISLLLWVPLLNFLVMPIAVVAGTRLYLQLEKG